MKRTWSIAALAACGAPAAPVAAPPATTTAETAPPPPTACPTGDALADAARRAWGAGDGPTEAICVALRAGGDTLWYLEGTWEASPEATVIHRHAALVTPGGEVRWHDGYETSYGEVMRSYAADHRAHDLDGDGVDELLFVSTYDAGGTIETSIGVATIRAGALVASDQTIPLGFDNSAADVDEAELRTCAADWVVDGRKVVITYAGDCERTGAAIYAWDGAALIPGW